MKVARVVLTVALVGAAASPAFAFFGIPTPVIDVGPEQAIWNGQLAQQVITAVKEAQQVINQYTMLRNEATNLNRFRNIATIQGAAQQARTIFNASKAAPPLEAGDVAADEVIGDEDDSTNRLQEIDAQAVTANGAQQQSQVTNTYESAIAGEANKTNALLSADEKQRQAQDADAVSTLLTEAGQNSAAAPGSTL